MGQVIECPESNLCRPTNLDADASGRQGKFLRTEYVPCRT